MRRLVVVGVLVACFVAMRSTRTVKAFVTNGHTWGTTQVAYYVNPDNLYVSANDAITSLQLAAMNWASQSNANVQLVYAGTTSGSSATLNRKNEIMFRNESNGSAAAVTYWWYDGTGHLVDADIIFYEASYVFFGGTTTCTGSSGAQYIQDVATHEFGHVLGLAHSPVGTATMYPYDTVCDLSWISLDPDDVAGIESLYPGGSTPQPPAAPSQLAVGASASNPSSSLSMSWADNATNESGYRVEQSTDGSTWAQVAQLGTNATTYTKTGLASGTTYWYRVAAFNSDGNSGYSNVASSSTQAATPQTQPPAAPSQLVVGVSASNPSSSLSLTWADNATNESGYRVEQSMDGSTWAQVAQLGTNATTYTKSGLASGTAYWYRVAAYNSGGSSGYTNVAGNSTQAAAAAISPTPPAAPAAPTSPSPGSGTSNLSGSVTLSWGAAAGAQAYDVYFGTTATPSLYASNVSSTSQRLGPLNAGGTYYWVVVAKNGAGNTSSPLWQFTTKATGKK